MNMRSAAGLAGEKPAATSVADLRAKGKMVARQAGGSTVSAFFEANKEAIRAVLPQHMTPDRMLKIALRALRTTPKLMDCTIDSLFGAVVSCAQLGLEPNTPQGHIYLIPFENRRKGITEVQIVIGYKGLVDLARRSGEIETIAARVAYKGDDFSIEYGTTDSIVHKPKIDGDAGTPIGVYAVAKLKGGGYQFEWMSVSQINQIRDGSQGYKTAVRFNKTDTPWISNWEEMAKKTVIRRLCKYLPMSIELAAAAALEGRAERGEGQGLSQVLDGIDYNILDSAMETEGVPVGEDDTPADQDGQKQITDRPEQPMGTTVNAQQGNAEKVHAGGGDTPTNHDGKPPRQQRQPEQKTSTSPAAQPQQDEDQGVPGLPEDDAGNDLFGE